MSEQQTEETDLGTEEVTEVETEPILTEGLLSMSYRILIEEEESTSEQSVIEDHSEGMEVIKDDESESEVMSTSISESEEDLIILIEEETEKSTLTDEQWQEEPTIQQIQPESETSEYDREQQDITAYETISYKADTCWHLYPALSEELAESLTEVSETMTTYPLTLLKKTVRQQLYAYDGEWSVYVKDLSTGESFVIHDQPMRSASIMKLFILGAVYNKIQLGELERTSDLVDLMGAMIRASSNEASNELIRRLGEGDFLEGINVVNGYIEEEGYSEATRLYNGFEDDSLHPNPDEENQTTTTDVGELLERIYTRSFGRRAVCNEVEEWLLGQETRYKIPRALPDGVLCGNKTGETETIENDCGLIYTTKGDYILCVMSSDWDSKTLAQERITAISASVYAYFSDPESYIQDQLSFFNLG